VKKIRILIIAVLIAAIMALHYLTLPQLVYHHAAYRILFYFPLVLGSFWFGLKGGLLVSATIILVYLPHMRDQWQGFSLEDFHNILEGVLLVSVGVVLGLLAERERRAQKVHAENQSFVAVGKAVSEIAHDMKAPLMCIGGFAEQVARTLGYENPSRKKLDIVIAQTARLEEMIRDMLEMGKDSTLKPSDSDLNDIVLEAVAMSQPMAAKAGVLLGNDLESLLPHLMIDRERVKRVVYNLLTNAIQACIPGESVMVRTARRKRRVTLEIIDSGCGVKQDQRKALFTPFFSTKTGGTGLGLAIARRIIDAHGGRIFFKPNSAKGSTFSVEFPV
jgi:two-component system sensor histidine kinase HydH